MNVHSLSNGGNSPELDLPHLGCPAGEMANALRPWSDETLRSFPPDQRYLVGVSGGRDSVALLHWLLGLGYRKLIVCHLDHQVRGRSSTADARFVERLATANDLTFE